MEGGSPAVKSPKLHERRVLPAVHGIDIVLFSLQKCRTKCGLGCIIEHLLAFTFTVLHMCTDHQENQFSQSDKGSR